MYMTQIASAPCGHRPRSINMTRPAATTVTPTGKQTGKHLTALIAAPAKGAA